VSAAGLQTITQLASDIGAQQFIIQQALLKMQTCMPVRVVKVSQDGDVAAAGTVDVKPLVQMVAADGQTIEHSVIHGVPYARTQGGTNAVIMDPQVGDIGVAVFASRDISGVKKDPTNPAGAPPPSLRAYDFADAIYLGVILTGTPTQYVRFTGDGITLHSPGKVTVEAPDIELDGDVAVSGTLTAQGDVVGQGTSLHNHVHGGVTTGSGSTGPPTP
jgi:hypothetical protein